ncbi:MAG TPA: HDOD domain-containing protein [Thermodesulfovibrio thiophilus]|uniref:HDOD domain-containing protein n=1 Tax=Thermodesulfovibrio thiophilus TaxID=340095 RepID=UPI001796E8ED|nr:HDOD domain-containing protein [Thermodesulfovibrio thiophilus]HHW19917.1 HDOD domain-containing protein [Thermodesulfovibrio thiophilus]HOA82486.1 HDOD domain-containing protein [Thermodesulfovibrio thiophilus]HQA03115.1 HDOD domain-containing protein [Thermodesulfovibrio thiophilus]HQD35476.1 HDOD domain-containing protein [Thermodesulfovibrio thiophilus]
MNVKEVIARVERIESLPTIPPILKKILSIIEDPNVSLNKITEFVSTDPTLTARILKMVNSPVYGFPGRISSISHAMVILGLNAVKGLLLGVSVFEIMQKNMIGLWEHSLSTAIFARIIAIKKELQSPEEISIAGLLHDIGKVIFIIAFKDEYLKLLESARIKKQYIYEVERDYFGITHAEIGGIIAQKWHFPSKLIEPIMYHHRPQVSEKFKLETAIVHLSNTLAIARGIGYSGEIFVPSVHVYTWELLNFRDEEIVEIFKEAEEPLYATGENFLSDE